MIVTNISIFRLSLNVDVTITINNDEYLLTDVIYCSLSASHDCILCKDYEGLMVTLKFL
jgi:hypothetical protein